MSLATFLDASYALLAEDVLREGGGLSRVQDEIGHLSRGGPPVPGGGHTEPGGGLLAPVPGPSENEANLLALEQMMAGL